MAIDRLSSTSTLLAALRAEGARKGERQERGGTTENTSGAASSQAGKTRDVSALRSELTSIVKGIAPDDQEALDAARPRIVRAVLLWEFGSELREHSQWQPMLDMLVQTLEHSEQHRAEFSGLITALNS